MMLLRNNALLRATSRMTTSATAHARCSCWYSSTTTPMSSPGTDEIVRIGTEDPRMSKIVKHGGVVYTSGQTDTSVEDITGQTKAVLSKIDDLLVQAGTDKTQLLTAQIWLKDIEKDFAPMNAVWSEWLDASHKPVRATVEAPMARPSILVEIQVTAASCD